MKSHQWRRVNRRVDSGCCGRCGRSGALKTTYHCAPCAAAVSAENAERQRRKRAAAAALSQAAGTYWAQRCSVCGKAGHNKRSCGHKKGV